MTAAGAISPTDLSAQVFSRDYVSLALMTLLMIAMVGYALFKSKRTRTPARIPRAFGFILIGAYALYYVVLWPSIITAT